jgi:hypothetical protein
MVRARDVMYGILVVAAAMAIGGYTNQIMYPAEAKDCGLWANVRRSPSDFFIAIGTWAKNKSVDPAALNNAEEEDVKIYDGDGSNGREFVDKDIFPDDEDCSDDWWLDDNNVWYNNTDEHDGSGCDDGGHGDDGGGNGGEEGCGCSQNEAQTAQDPTSAAPPHEQQHGPAPPNSHQVMPADPVCPEQRWIRIHLCYDCKDGQGAYELSLK